MASGPSIKIEMLGDKLMSRRLRSLARRSLDFSPVLHTIGIKWVGWIEEQFGSEGMRFNGVRWQGLAIRTIKARGGAAHPILFDQGNLFDEMTDVSNLSVTDHTLSMKIDGEQAEIGERHQTGTSHMPKRRILDFTPMDRQEMLDDLGDFLFEHGRGRVL